MRRLVVMGIALFAMTTTALGQNLVVMLSTDTVEITSNFTGASISVFGVLEGARLGGTAYDVVVVLEGPNEPAIARRKERTLGFWINRAEVRFSAVPAFYALQSTRPLSEIADASVIAGTELGLANVARTARAGTTIGVAFTDALLRLRQEEGVYYENAGAVTQPSATVFQSTFALPADVPVGDYTVEVVVFQDGEPVATASTPMAVTKTGAEQFIFDASRNAPWAYAIAVVLLAGAIGWLGGVIFRRD